MRLTFSYQVFFDKEFDLPGIRVGLSFMAPFGYGALQHSAVSGAHSQSAD
jgi:hypothetical protein